MSRLYKKRSRSLAKKIVVASTILTFIFGVTIAGVSQLRWRAYLLVLHIAGQIPDIEFRQLVSYKMPGSQQSMAFLVERRNPYAVIRNVRTSRADIDTGSGLFRARCLGCHASDGSSGQELPPLSGPLKNGDSDWAIYRSIRLKPAHTAAKAPSLSETELWQVVAFIQSLDKSQVSQASVEGTSMADLRLPYQELAAIHEPSEDWLTFSGSYSSSRHSMLTQINPANVGNLSLRWIHQFDAEPSEASPIVRKGIMFIPAATPAGSRNVQVIALDAEAGSRVWTHKHELAENTPVGEMGVMASRGVALLDDKVYFGTPDARLVALSAQTGAEQWHALVATDVQRYYISSAPLAYRDLVVTGVATHFGGKAFVAAYDANSGKERWRFDAIPGPGQPGNETWSGDSWREGGAPTWLTGSYDPELDLLYWTVGNPKPDYDADVRRGDNLYTNSIVALRGTTGQLVWHFQFTPADDHDWDANQMPVLADRKTASGTEKDVLFANRNGFFYVFDRNSGRYLNASPFVRQTWTAGLDTSGRPTPVANVRNRNGLLLFPGPGGGTNWWPPSFDPLLDLMFVPALEQGMVYFSSRSSPPKEGGGRPFYTAIRALQAST
jgi:alcohol dehydrogenase (cytochrome c)